jgi:cytochrome c biogenesis protein
LNFISLVRAGHLLGEEDHSALPDLLCRHRKVILLVLSKLDILRYVDPFLGEQMDNNKSKSIVDRTWDLFASVKFAVVIFSAIALTSIVGTVIEQNADPEKNIKILTKMFGSDAAPALYSVLDKLGFMNMYHSWWFITFLLLFAANLIICSVDRLPRIWRLVREPIRPLSEEYLEKMSIKRILTLKGKQSEVKEQASQAVRKLGLRPSEAATDKGVQFFAEKGNFTRLGVYITHFSILIIMAGAIIGIFFGFNGWLPLGEGETSSFALKGRDAKIPLGFDIRCDRFEVDFYGDSDMPKAYKSWLTVLQNGQEVIKKVITVNDPLKYKGITFYQSSFGTIPDSFGRGILSLDLVSKDGQSEQIQTRLGGQFTIPGTSIIGRITNFSPALNFDQSGRAVTYDSNMVNPAIYVEFTGLGQKPLAGWIYKRFPQTWNLPDGSKVEFLNFWGVQYTGLQVRKDPGVGLVYLGCILLALGLYITFFMSHRRIWVNVSEEKGATKILIGASANRNRASFERKIERLVGVLDSGSKGGK